MNSRVSQATYNDNMNSTKQKFIVDVIQNLRFPPIMQSNPFMEKFIVDAIQNLRLQPNMQCNPFMEQLEKSEDTKRVYVVMHIPSYNDRPTPYLLAAVPVENFPTGIDEIVNNTKFAMKTVCVKDYCDTGSNFQDICGLEVPDVVDTNDLKSVLEGITKKMWSAVEGEENVTHYNIVEILKKVDVQGLIIYGNANSQDYMKRIYKSMITGKWEEICKDGSENKRKQKKHKSV